jgi:hypothetical protein
VIIAIAFVRAPQCQKIHLGEDDAPTTVATGGQGAGRGGSLCPHLSVRTLRTLVNATQIHRMGFLDPH